MCVTTVNLLTLLNILNLKIDNFVCIFFLMKQYI